MKPSLDDLSECLRKRRKVGIKGENKADKSCQFFRVLCDSRVSHAIV